jgi:hypothetical protein
MWILYARAKQYSLLIHWPRRMGKWGIQNSHISLSHWHYLIINIYLNGFLCCKIETSIAQSVKERKSKITAAQRKTESMRGRQEEDKIT